MEGLCLRFVYLVLAISISWLISSCGACEEELKCGEYVFRYPFGRKGSGCGDLALQLDCDYEEQKPLLNISGRQYYILYPYWVEIIDKSITVIEKNLLNRYGCNPLSRNYTAQAWSNPQFRIEDGYKNVTLWGVCDAGYRDYPTLTASLQCNSTWHYNLTTDLRPLKRCQSRVVLPVDQSVIKGDQIEDGLKIRWNVGSDCMECESSQGICGYYDSMKFYCNCSGTVHTKKCPAHNSKLKTLVILGCSIGGAGLVAALVLFLIYYVRMREAPLAQGLSRDFHNYHRNDMEAGRPGYMIVYLGKLQDGRVVAVKRLHQENSRRVEQFINEVQILSSLCHPNLVRLYGCTCPQSPILLLVYEFVPNGTLSDHLHGSRRTLKGLAWGTRLNIAIETAQALAYLHSIDSPIFHRDVKSNNILLDEHFRAKVADFGLSRLLPVNVSHVTTAPQGTPGYLDPEYHQCFQLTEKSDVYSFGVVLVELISAKVAVDITRNRNEISLANMAIDKIRRGVLDELVDPDLKIETDHEVKVMVAAVAELAFECLARDRDFRPDMKEVVSRLEEIKQLQESKVSSRHIDMTSTVSLNAVEEKLPIMSSDQITAQFRGCSSC
ncbi:hypothetical protein KI387_010719 [Taxus chinensis]|uniref:Protein kinase domain-containing protein n=1 Tax=Taxus chinensis TaxID=29808 RepID=A0AA38FMD7_TAXCH|nr:hypothetical protein KI387_010719 [Taxus chinensis]